MSEDQFTKLFKYIEEFRSDVNKQFEKNHQEHLEMQGAISELAGQLRDYHQELIMMGRKMDRMERWIHQIAQETGVKLDFLKE